MRIAGPAVGRGTAVQLSAWVLAAICQLPPQPALATLVSVCAALDEDATTRNLDPSRFQVRISAPGFDSWCAVTVRVSDPDETVQYLWLKDAAPKARRIWAAAKLKPGVVELTQALKVGYRVKPLLYCSRHGLFEGAPFVVGSSTTMAAGRSGRSGRISMTAESGGGAPDFDTLLWTAGLILAAYASGYTSEGYEPHRL